MSKSRGSIFKRGSGWAYRFSYRDNNGQRRFKSAQGFDTKQLAEKIFDARIIGDRPGQRIKRAQSIASRLFAIVVRSI